MPCGHIVRGTKLEAEALAPTEEVLKLSNLPSMVYGLTRNRRSLKESRGSYLTNKRSPSLAE